MGEILFSNWFIPIVEGIVASLVAALLAAYLLSRRPSVLRLYRKSLDKVCNDVDLQISLDERQVLQNALKDTAVVKAIKERTADPGEEAQLLCEAIKNNAPSSSPLTASVLTARVVERLLYAEFMMEDTDKFQNSHHNREPYFAEPSAPTALTVVLNSGQVILTWHPVQHPGIQCYHINRSTSINGPFISLATVKTTVGNILSSADDKELINDTIYYYTVIAESRALRQGYASTPVSIMYTPLSASENTVTQPAPVGSSTFFTSQEVWEEIADKSVDREQDLEKLLADFQNHSRRLFLIEGFGGLGKTTLASRLATAVSQLYHVLWIDCEGIAVTAERFLREMGWSASNQYNYPLLSAIVESLQSSQEEKDSGLFDFLAFISQAKKDPLVRPVAFFFDDYHLVTDAALKHLVLKIAESHFNVKVVLMIRFLPIELHDEVVIANTLQLQGLNFQGCRELIQACTLNYPALRNIDSEKLRRIWELTGQGVPTALRILISMTRNLSLDDTLEELPTLTTATRERWFDKLFSELSSEEQQVATEASIFRRPTLLRVLMAVSQCPRSIEVIAALVDRFVLIFDGNYYSMHALWSDYIRRRLSLSDVKELHRRAALFYRDFKSQDHYAEVMSHIEGCYHFIKAEDMEQAELALISIASILRSWGLYQEFTDILNEIEIYNVDQGRQLNSQLKLEKCAMLYAQGSVDEAISILKVLANTDTGEIQIRALLELGWIYIETGERREAERLLKLSREFAHQSNLLKLEAEALARLQHMTFHECDYDQTLAYNEERLNILQQLRDDPEAREAIAWIHHEIGNVYRERGFYEKALELYQQDQAFWNERGNPPSRVGWITYDIGQIYRDQGKLWEAQSQFENALQIFMKMQHLFGIAHVKIELGRVSAKLGQTEIAIQLVTEAIDLLHKVKGVAGEAYALGALGQIYLGLGKPNIALPYFQQTLEIETKLYSIKGRAWSLHQMSLTFEQQGKRELVSDNRIEACKKFSEAATHITQAQELYAQLGAATSIYGIKENSARIQQSCNGC